MEEDRSTQRSRRPVSAVGVVGEILITAGVIVLLYVGWQLWLGDVIYGAQANAQGQELSESWAEAFDESTATPAPTPTDAATAAPTTTPSPSAAAEPSPAKPVILPEPTGTEDFGVVRIPRFGDDYAVPVAGGVTRSGTLDRQRIGHYPGTGMPGQVGNFAVAGHRTTYGAPFHRIADLRLGDAIVIETKAGWYTYRFRTLEYVQPDAVDVLLSVPQAPDVPAGTRYMTMTSCSPMYSAAERIIAYSVFESFTPRGDGPPASLSKES